MSTELPNELVVWGPLTTPRPDLEGESVQDEGLDDNLKKYMDYGAKVDYAHGYIKSLRTGKPDPSLLIADGRRIALIDGKRCMESILLKGNDLAEKTYLMAKRGGSCGYSIQGAARKDGKKLFMSAIYLTSIDPMPQNPDCRLFVGPMPAGVLIAQKKPVQQVSIAKALQDGLSSGELYTWSDGEPEPIEKAFDVADMKAIGACSKCKHKSKEGATHCEKCNTELTDANADKAFTVGAGIVTEGTTGGAALRTQEFGECPKCKHKNKEGLMHCEKCNTDLGDGTTEEVSKAVGLDTKPQSLDAARPVLHPQAPGKYGLEFRSGSSTTSPNMTSSPIVGIRHIQGSVERPAPGKRSYHIITASGSHYRAPMLPEHAKAIAKNVGGWHPFAEVTSHPPTPGTGVIQHQNETLTPVNLTKVPVVKGLDVDGDTDISSEAGDAVSVSKGAVMDDWTRGSHEGAKHAISAHKTMSGPALASLAGVHEKQASEASAKGDHFHEGFHHGAAGTYNYFAQHAVAKGESEDASEDETPHPEHVGFKELSEKIQSEHGMDKDKADAIAAAIGRKKYGAKRMEEAAHEGKPATEVEKGVTFTTHHKAVTSALSNMASAQVHPSLHPEIHQQGYEHGIAMATGLHETIGHHASTALAHMSLIHSQAADIAAPRSTERAFHTGASTACDHASSAIKQHYGPSYAKSADLSTVNVQKGASWDEDHKAVCGKLDALRPRSDTMHAFSDSGGCEKHARMGYEHAIDHAKDAHQNYGAVAAGHIRSKIGEHVEESNRGGMSPLNTAYHMGRAIGAHEAATTIEHHYSGVSKGADVEETDVNVEKGFPTSEQHGGVLPENHAENHVAISAKFDRQHPTIPGNNSGSALLGHSHAMSEAKNLHLGLGSRAAAHCDNAAKQSWASNEKSPSQHEASYHFGRHMGFRNAANIIRNHYSGTSKSLDLTADPNVTKGAGIDTFPQRVEPVGKGAMEIPESGGKHALTYKTHPNNDGEVSSPINGIRFIQGHFDNEETPQGNASHVHVTTEDGKHFRTKMHTHTAKKVAAKCGGAHPAAEVKGKEGDEEILSPMDRSKKFDVSKMKTKAKPRRKPDAEKVEKAASLQFVERGGQVFVQTQGAA